LTALLSDVNYRWIHLHATVGMMFWALLLALVLIVLDLGGGNHNVSIIALASQTQFVYE
jgi:hypothetical protein